jgi:hypothetical protein
MFRRIDPDSRTLGEYYAQVLRPEFGIDAIIGASEEDLKLYVTPTTQSYWNMFKMSWKGPEKTLACMSISDAMAMGDDYKK